MMKNPWVLSALSLGLLGGFMLHDLVIRPAWANPADVKGSPNVAVTSYRNTQGTFVVWADGHTTVAGAPVSYQAGRPIGSGNVAIGSVNLAGVPNVLYADGSLRPPSDTRARSRFPPARQLSGSVLSPPAPPNSITWSSLGGSVAIQPLAPPASSSVTPGVELGGVSPCSVGYRTTVSRFGGEEIQVDEPYVVPGILEVTFDPPMQSPPIVTCTPVGVANLQFQGWPLEADSSASVESVSAEGCRIRFVGQGVSFLAIGD